MKKIKFLSLAIAIIAGIIYSCTQNEELFESLEEQNTEEVVMTSDVDPDTPEGVTPNINEYNASNYARSPDINDNVEWYTTWTEEFGGDNLKANKWIISNDSDRDVGPGVRNNQIDRWNWKPSNVEVKNGKLYLKVSKKVGMEQVTNNDGTKEWKWVRRLEGASVETRNKANFRYGFYEAKIDIAEVAKGTHTAFWLQGYNQSNIDDSGEDGAEIDIFESVYMDNNTSSTSDDKVQVAIHYDGYNPNTKGQFSKEYKTPGIHNGYNTFGLHWTPDFLQVYYNGEKVRDNSGNPFKITIDNQGSDVSNYGNPIVPQVFQWLWLSTGAAFKPTNFNAQPSGFLTSSKVDYVRVYKLRPKVGETFKIRNKKANTWLRTTGSGNNSVIKQNNNTYGNWTNWKVKRISGNKYYIINVGTNKHIRPATTSNNSRILLKPNTHTGTWTQWQFIDAGGDGHFFIKNIKTGKYLKAATNGNGALTISTSKTGDEDWFKWKLIW